MLKNFFEFVTDEGNKQGRVFFLGKSFQPKGGFMQLPVSIRQGFQGTRTPVYYGCLSVTNIKHFITLATALSML
jgi:hypothetical protein